MESHECNIYILVIYRVKKGTIVSKRHGWSGVVHSGCGRQNLINRRCGWFACLYSFPAPSSPSSSSTPSSSPSSSSSPDSKHASNMLKSVRLKLFGRPRPRQNFRRGVVDDLDCPDARLKVLDLEGYSKDDEQVGLRGERFGKQTSPYHPAVVWL